MCSFGILSCIETVYKRIDGFCSFMHFEGCKRIKRKISKTLREDIEELLIKELYVFIGYLALFIRWKSV